jgi:hypothetical protein
VDQIPQESAPSTTSPLAIASVVLAFVGAVTYCCGSFLCLGWIAPVFWILGAILGFVGMGGGGSSKTVSIVGIIANLGLLAVFVGLIVMGVGFGVLSSLMQDSNSYSSY